MSLLTRIRLYMVIGLCAAPMMFGTEPSPTCDQTVITGHVRTFDGEPAVGVDVRIESVYAHGFEYDYPDPPTNDGCVDDYPSTYGRDTTDTDGAFEFSVHPYYDLTTTTDSFRIIITMPNDSSFVGLAFPTIDTTSTRPIYFPSLYGSGCQCSSSNTYRAGYLFIYHNRDFTLP